MRKAVIIILGVIFFVNQAAATNYYVDAVTGSNSNNGLTPAHAFATLIKVSYGTTPLVGGDTVFVRNGVYGTPDLLNLPSSFAILAVTTPGLPGAPIVFTNYPGESPVIQFNNWNAIYIQASHIEIIGLTVRGAASVISLTDALNQPGGCVNTAGPLNPFYNGNGINFDPNGVDGPPHHITVRNCKIYDCPGGGLGGTKNDYITLENNEVYNNAWYSIYGNSGISLLHLTDIDGNSTTYKNIIRNNRVYGNQMFVPWKGGGCVYTDGNGIIIDYNQNNNTGGSGIAYIGQTLIENNVVYRNGGRGIHVYKSNGVTIVNNTCYKNCKTPEIADGEITVITGSNNRVFNNVMYAAEGEKLSSVSGAVNFIENNNLMYGSGQFGYFNSRDIFANPGFADSAANDFRLTGTSPGIDAGNDTTGKYSVKDIFGVNRPYRLLPDMGAYEYTGALPVRTTFTGGNLALSKIGDGTTLNTGTATTGAPMGNPVQVAEYTLAGVSTGVNVLFPSSGANKLVVDGFTTSYGGQLALASDGRYLSLIGYNADVSSDFTVLRAGDKIVGRLDYALTADTTTRFPNSGTGAAFSATSVRGAATVNGSSYFATGNAIFRNITHNSKTSSTVPTGSLTSRSANRVEGGNTFIIDQGDNSVKMHNGTVATALPGIPTGGNSRQTVLAFNMDAAIGWNGTPYDVVYVSVANSATPAGIQKYYFDNGSNTWLDGGLYNPALGGAATTGFYSITGSIVNENPVIYGIKGLAENNALIKLIDNSSRTGNWLTATGGQATAATLLNTAGIKYTFRGVAFTPTQYGNNPPAAALFALPVKLISFEGYLLSADVLLKWITASEAGIDSYIVQRSTNGTQFLPIGKVAPLNSAYGAAYGFTDKNMAAGVYYYRIKSVDADGKTTYSKTILIRKGNVLSGAIKVFPNPVAAQLNVSYPVADKQSVLLLVDMAGRVLVKKNLIAGTSQVSMDVSSLANGLYSLVLYTGKDRLLSKFVK